MKNADKFVVGGQVYDVLSPATFGDYMETIGSACINPDGYAENKLFLAYDDNVQKLFRATTAIAYSELLIKDTNCEPTTMAEALANALSAGGVSYDNSDSGLTASNVQDAIDEVNGDVETVNSDLSNMTNPNLLDNPFFTVNQRGQTSWNALGYTVDRWKDGSGNSHSITLNNDGTITITSNDSTQTWFTQFLENTYGDGSTDFTLSALVTAVSGDVWLSMKGDTFTKITQTGLFKFTAKPSDANFARIVVGGNSSITIKAVKLEKGTVSTLAMDIAPNYAEELLKCQRYYIRYTSLGTYSGIATTYASNNKFYGHLYLPCAMRVSPTPTISGTTKAYVYKNNEAKNVTSIAVQRYYSNTNVLKFNITPDTTTNFADGDMAEYQLETGAYVELSADL